MKSDIEIAREAKLLPIAEIAEKIGISTDALEFYGRNKAKIDISRLGATKRDGKLVLVTAITPTPAGEGKTTTTIGLADALTLLGKKTATALREPSLGPVFGVKGGATGGGFAQVAPMDDINLHFTGDFHAIGAANNLLAAMIDNHIFQGNALRFDTRKITWRRCVDMNDRQLRQIVSGLGAKNGFAREDGFEITVASEIMAVFCLAENLTDLKKRLANIVVGFNLDGKPIRAGELNAQGAMTAILRDAFKPNLVQTLGGTPAIVHGGPFANIAHGCNSVVATRTALRCADFVVTEAGFGADLGAEKFCDVKCRKTGLRPDATVLVATCRALKMHGGVAKSELQAENVGAIERGIENLFKHYDNMTREFALPCVVALNKFTADTKSEIDCVKKLCENRGITCVLCEGWEKGGAGAVELAEKVLALCENSRPELHFTYDDADSLQTKIEKVATKIYGADGVEYSAQAKRDLQNISDLGFSEFPVCIAKTQNSLSDDAKKLGAPKGWKMQVRGAKVSAGAEFVVIYAGEIMTMPGLPKIPAAEKIDVNENGDIVGIF